MIPESILSCADIEWRDGLPFSRHFNDIYYSRQDGQEESFYTFIEGNRLPERWYPSQKCHNSTFQICEFGFGTGLNFFSTAQYWHQQQPQEKLPNEQWLHYHSIEKYPLTKDDFKRSAALWPMFETISSQLIADYPLPFRGVYRIDFPKLKVSLFLYWMDLVEGLSNLAMTQTGKMDAFYLDGFAPAKNPDAWAEALFTQVKQLANKKATVATFSAAGFVRRGLMSVGFNMSKRKGFGSKREMLVGDFAAEAKQRSQPTQPTNKKRTVAKSLYQPPTYQGNNKVAVIGAGIAGCSTARELAEAGFKVTVYEQSSRVASGASGSSAGIYYPFLSSDINPTSQLYLQAYYTLLQSFRKFQLEEYISPIGVLLKNTGAKIQTNITHWLNHQNELKRWINCSENNDIFFPLSGYVDLAGICLSLTQHPNIETFFNHTVSQLEPKDGAWDLYVENQSKHYGAVVLCNSFEATKFLPKQFYPANKVRGQTLIIRQPDMSPLSSVWCDSVYAIPQQHGSIYGGATFELNNDNLEFSSDSQQQLVTELSELLGTEIKTEDCDYGRVGFRYCSIDRVPYVGPVSDHSIAREQFNHLHHGKRLSSFEPIDYIPGLYVNIAHGARGITSSFLSAQIIKSYLLNQSFPIPFKLVEKVHPNRQLFKELKKPPQKRVSFFN